jgi:TRAP-type mannitol/chloroaromatic compound transport system substrate-binding protein
MQRRKFLVKAGGTLAAAAVAPVVGAPNVIAQQRVQWRMPTMWVPANDILLTNAQTFAKIVDELTGGRFKIQVFAAGELMPATGVFDACAQGTVEAFSGASYYWAGKEPGLQWFTSVPFGLNSQGYYAWFHFADGLKLWEEAYAPFGVVPRPANATSPQMVGWFRKKINSVDDLKGLKIRIPGLGGKVYSKAGAAVVLLPPGEIYTALERGTLDAAEFIGPHDDLKLGFQNAARYYYYPGWHEPTSVSEYSFNKKAYDALSADFKHALEYAAATIWAQGTTEFFYRNVIGMQRLTTEFKTKVEVVRLPDAVIAEMRKLSALVMQEESERNPLSRKVAASFQKMVTQSTDWARISDGAYYSLLG